jgi:hypothetical protein
VIAFPREVSTLFYGKSDEFGPNSMASSGEVMIAFPTEFTFIVSGKALDQDRSAQLHSRLQIAIKV